MALLLIGEIDNPEVWIAELKRKAPDLDVRVWPDVGLVEDIDAVLTLKHPLGTFQKLLNLKVIISTGAGVDHILRDPDLPHGVPIVRIVDPSLTSQMTEYVMLAVLRFHRRMFEYQELQKQKQWEFLPPLDTASCHVGILGLGVLGTDIAQKLRAIALSVRSWSRTPKTLDGIECFYGRDQFSLFLSKCRVLVCLLPLTPETQGILNSETFAQLPRGAYLINVARGQHLVEEDLLDALASGQLAGACLDVFYTEPLPQEHPFWSHPLITVTPHIASKTIPACVAKQIVDAIHRSRSGMPLRNVVDLQRGY